MAGTKRQWDRIYGYGYQKRREPVPARWRGSGIGLAEDRRKKSDRESLYLPDLTPLWKLHLEVRLRSASHLNVHMLQNPGRGERAVVGGSSLGRASLCSYMESLLRE